MAGLDPNSSWVGFLWVLFGLAMATGGALVAGGLTAATVGPSTDDYSGLLFLLTVPAGWAAGFIAAALTGWSIDRRARRSGWSRLFLVSIVPIVSVVLLLVVG